PTLPSDIFPLSLHDALPILGMLLVLGDLRPASASPIFFLQAENDYSLAPSRTLYAAIKTSHESAQIRIYPPYGSSPQEGHSFAYCGASVWFEDVLRFLEANCKP